MIVGSLSTGAPRPPRAGPAAGHAPTVPTRAGAAAAAATFDLLPPATVTTRSGLVRGGLSHAAVTAHLDAHRWRRWGLAVVLHNGPLHPDEVPFVALLNCGPRAALTAFTVAAQRGLQGWDREEVHILVPAGARVRPVPGLRVRLHWSSDWSGEDVAAGRHALGPALVRAASTFGTPRPAIGLLAAGVQQRLVTVRTLRQAIRDAPRARHRRALMTSLDDIEQGAHALSEIDFARLCRKHRLREPLRQAIRPDPRGRRRYLDAEWRTETGRLLVVEVDGALHLAVRRWWGDQLRQNEVALSDRTVLRFPSVVVRHEEPLVVDQLGRGLAM